MDEQTLTDDEIETRPVGGTETPEVDTGDTGDDTGDV